MAKTYYAEGRQVAYFLRGVFIIGGLALYFYIPGLHWGFFFGILLGSVLVAEILGVLWTRSRRAKKKGRKKTTSSSQKKSRRTTMECRSDEVILSSRLDDMSGPEFERLLAIYFRDQGYEVKEVGIGGNDGGVDLVITDKWGEKIAVQAKCYADHHSVPVQTVRELVGAKRNHDCILSLLVTTSDLTAPAKKEAEQSKVDYWHGALLEQKLTAWGKWQPGKKTLRSTSSARLADTKTRKEIAATSAAKCAECGSPMTQRKSRQGKEFLGCASYPKCRYTKSL